MEGGSVSLFADSSWEEPRLWHVDELTAYIAELFNLDYRLRDVRVEGEVSNFKEARSGHLYFTLKDERAQLRCVMWRSDAERLSFSPRDGDAVVARGRVGVYERGGDYQLYVKSLSPQGRGELAIAFEELRHRLEAEGLFAPERKQRPPTFPRRIGIVTSADAAALQDILNVLNRRCRFVSVLIAPTLVQGSEAPAQIIRALRWLDGRDDIDTIILARGGGSIEDLWAFNDEAVARAVFEARHPIICGVGHETDFTIADFVADVRAPTPSAAAELATPDSVQLRPVIRGLQQALDASMWAKIEQRRERVAALTRNLRHLGPQARLDGVRQHVDLLAGRLDHAVARLLERKHARFDLAQARLASVSPVSTLRRGYAIVRQVDATLVRSVDDVTAGDRIEVTVVDGSFDATVENGPNVNTTYQ
jgi:exodeoxyribonuclease VII large subunit